MRYYERAGLMALPARTSSGYRDYDDAAAGQLLFITRARRMGLSCEQVTSLLPVWAGTNCGAAHERVDLRLVALAYCGDNAAMIANAALLRHRRGESDDPRSVDAVSRLALEA